MALDQKTARYSWVDYFYLVKAKWPTIALCFALLVMVGVGIRLKTPRIYEAACRVAIDLPEDPEQVRKASTQMRATSLDKMSRIEAGVLDRAVLLEVIEVCDLVSRWGATGTTDALAILKARVRVESEEGEDAIDVVAKALSKKMAADIANAIGQIFVDQREASARSDAEQRLAGLTAEVNSHLDAIEAIEERLYQLARPSTAGDASEDEAPQLRRELVSVNYLLRSLEAKQQLAKVELRNASSRLSILATAGEEDAYVADSGYLSVLLYGFAGIMLGLAVVGLTSQGKSRATVLHRVADALGIKLVGMAPIPSIPLAKLNRPSGPVIESYRDLRQRIHRLPAADSMLLTLVPADEEALVDEVTANLATVIADSGQTVVVIDGDFRRGRMHSLFEATATLGLSDYLSGEMRMEETVVKTRRPNLWLMPAGPVHEDPSGLISSKRMTDLVWDMRSRFDYVILVSPSMEEASDAGALIGHSDHVLMVASYRGHTLQKLKLMQQRIELSGGETSGLVFSQRFETPADRAKSGGARKVATTRPRL